MFKKISLRLRLTLFTSLLIAVCCIGLGIVLSLSAYRMADSIGAAVVQPAQTIGDIHALPMASTQTVNQAKHGYRTESLLYTAIAVLLGGTLTYYVSGKALNPVRTLNSQIKNINAHNLDESLEVPPANDELAELTSSFNDMTDKLAQAFATQKRFSADAAHELRTPLAVLQTRLDVFSKKAEHTLEEYKALIQTFQKQVHRMRGLVTELLDIANMEHTFHVQPIPLQALFSDILGELSPLAEEKNISLSLNAGTVSIMGDYPLLYRAFYNLAENAVKYNSSGGKVNIEVAASSDNMAVVTVKDTGIGIPASMKEQIFEPFFRVDKSRSREMGGAGLGLALVDTIIKKHNGTITVSENSNGGACFTVTLPIS